MSARAAWIACALAVLLGAGVRLAGCGSDFWLDEVWSWATARRLDSWLGVLSDIHHSNNNHLNTWFLYVLGDRASVWAYRLPAWLAGSATIALAAALAARRGRLEAVFAAWLTAGCFALIHFSSEARGYAPAVCFALLALRALVADLEDARPWGAPVFAVAVTLGLLSHLVFAFFWAGALAWSGRRAWRAWRRERRGRAALARLVRLHALPAAFLGLLWLVDLRHLELGGGNPTDFAWVSSRLFGFAFGLPVWRALAWPYAALAAALLLLALRRLARRGDDVWILHAAAIAGAPLAAIASVRPDVVAVRYFLIGVALALLLASDALAAGVRAGGTRRVLALALAAAFLVGNGVHTAAFLEHGRGGYAAALRHMAEHTPDAEIRVASDHDFRTGLVLGFHARALPPDRRLVYRRRGEPGPPAEWRIVHAPQRPDPLPAQLRDPAGHRYLLSASFDHAAISGFHWALYRLEGAARRQTSTPKRLPVKGVSPAR